jgi:ankyrin repeat protein
MHSRRGAKEGADDASTTTTSKSPTTAAVAVAAAAATTTATPTVVEVAIKKKLVEVVEDEPAPPVPPSSKKPKKPNLLPAVLRASGPPIASPAPIVAKQRAPKPPPSLSPTGDAVHIMQLSMRGPCDMPRLFSGVEPLLVGQDKTTIAETLLVPPCSVVYRFDGSGSLSVVNMLTRRAVLLPPWPHAVVQVAVVPPLVVALHADDTLQVYDVHSALPKWKASLRCSAVLTDASGEPSNAPDAGARRVLMVNDVWIAVASNRRVGMWSLGSLINGGGGGGAVDDDSATAASSDAASAAVIPCREIVLDAAEHSLQLRVPLCSIDERGRFLLGAYESFVLYDGRFGVPMFRFRCNGLPPRFLALRWTGENIVSMEERGARVFRVMPLATDTAGVFSQVDLSTVGDVVLEGKTKRADAPPVVVESRLAPLIPALGGAHFTSLSCTPELAIFGDSNGQTYRLPLIAGATKTLPTGAAPAAPAPVSAEPEQVAAPASPRNGSSAAFATAAQFEALSTVAKTGVVDAFKAAVSELPDASLLLGYLGSERESVLHVAAECGYVELIKWIAKKYPGGVDQVRGDNRSALHCAAALGHVAACDALIDAGTSVQLVDKDGALAAHLFCSNKWPRRDAAASTALLRRLLGDGELERADRFGYTPLHYAVVSQNELAILELLDRGASPKTVDAKGNTILHSSVETGSVAVVDAVLEWGVPLRAVNKKGLLASELARKRNFPDLAGLIERATFLSATGKRSRRQPTRAIVQHPDNDDEDPRVVPTASPRPAAVLAPAAPAPAPAEAISPRRRQSVSVGTPPPAPPLQSKGSLSTLMRRVRGATDAAAEQQADASQLSAEQLASPEVKAILAAAKNSLDDLKALNKKSAALLFAATDRLQQTALHIAAFNNHADSVRWLLSHKKCPAEFVHLSDRTGQTALHVAASAKSEGACAALLEYGASAAACDQKQTTPFHYAARSAALLPVMAAMLASGARLDARDDKGDTPLIQACFKGAVRVAEWLMQRGASAAATNQFGENCLHAAARGGDVAVVALLLDYGVSTTQSAPESGTPRDVAVACGNADVVAAFDTFSQLREASKKQKKKARGRGDSTPIALDGTAQSFAPTIASPLYALAGGRATTIVAKPSAPVTHIARCGDHVAVVSSSGTVATYELAQDASKGARLLSTLDGVVPTLELVANERGTLMLGSPPARGKRDVAVFSFITDAVSARDNAAERALSTNELTILLDLDGGGESLNGPAARQWSDYAVSSARARPVVGVVSSAQSSDAANIALCVRAQCIAACGSLCRPPLPFDRRSSLIAALQRSARHYVGGVDDVLLPFFAVIAVDGFRFLYLAWRHRDSRGALVPGNVVDLFEKAAAALLLVGSARAASKTSTSTTTPSTPTKKL